MNDLSNSKWLIITAIVSGDPGKKEMNYFLGKYVTTLIHSFTTRADRIILHGGYQYSPRYNVDTITVNLVGYS